MKNGHLPAKWAWVTYKFLKCGIGTMTNTMEEDEEFLNDHDFNLLNILGTARTVKKGWRKLHTTLCLWGIWVQELGYRATDRKTEPAAAALQYLEPHK